MIKDKILLNNDGNEKIALAVSGGADSMAMLYLLHTLGAELIVITVDHGLRKESAAEAAYVKKVCEGLGVPHVTLKWEHNGITSNVHDQARDARYNLMTEWCKKNNVGILCTAHHLDDRVEHFFIRISRGAGLLGLIDHYEMEYNGVKIVRPLFECSKSELVNYLKHHNIIWYEDSSNRDEKYLRTNIRNWLASMPQSLDPPLFKKRVIGVKENLKRAASVVNRLFDEVLREDVEFLENGQAVIKALPREDEIVYMLISHILPRISGEKDPPRMSGMQVLYNKMREASFKRATLGGCIVEKIKDGFLVRKE